MTPEIESLVQRVGRLERQNRRLKLMGLGVVLCVTVLLFAGADNSLRTIEAEKIVLRDAHGRARITIGTPAFAGAAVFTKAADPIIWFSDDKGTDRVILSMDGLFFTDDKARPAVSVESGYSGLSGFRVFGHNGKVLLWSAP